jgi:hypothetical protein
MNKMKNFNYVVLSISLLFFLSCEDELNIDPAQSITTETALSSEGTLLGILVGAYDEAGQSASYGGINHLASDLLGNTDQVTWSGTFVDPREFYLKDIRVTNAFVAGLWSNSYEVINQANLVIDHAGLISDENTKSVAVGEAKFLRALSYYDLVRHFGDVPLRMTGISNYEGVDLDMARNASADVYNQIATDLTDAYNTLPESNGVYADKYAALALRARVHLQLGNFEEARDDADIVLTESGHSLAPTFAGAFNNFSDGVEDIFAFQVTSQTGSNSLITFYASEANGGRGGDISLNDEFFDLFSDTNDERSTFYYEDDDNKLTSKYTYLYGNVPTIRIGEMHLIRAEANFRLDTEIGLSPLAEVNALRGRSGAAAVPATDLDLDFFFDERQRELSFEGHLIHDVKRFGKPAGSEAPNSTKLVFPIPQAEMDANSLMVQNPGYGI